MPFLLLNTSHGASGQALKRSLEDEVRFEPLKQILRFQASIPRWVRIGFNNLPFGSNHHSHYFGSPNSIWHSLELHSALCPHWIRLLSLPRSPKRAIQIPAWSCQSGKYLRDQLHDLRAMQLWRDGRLSWLVWRGQWKVKFDENFVFKGQTNVEQGSVHGVQGFLGI